MHLQIFREHFEEQRMNTCRLFQNRFGVKKFFTQLLFMFRKAMQAIFWGWHNIYRITVNTISLPTRVPCHVVLSFLQLSQTAQYCFTVPHFITMVPNSLKCFFFQLSQSTMLKHCFFSDSLFSIPHTIVYNNSGS